ncbi:MAG: hypothetical protein QOJ30_2118, partial [Pseudonocardiales bacterium]|nr:hypothetical protein [Pseudonocardiales bacterium]
NNTIRALWATPARTELDRVNANSRDRSPSRRTSGAATDMPSLSRTTNRKQTNDTRH